MEQAKKGIQKYEHPYATVDGVVFRYRGEHLEVLLTQRKENPQKGLWSLPGGFVDIDKRLDDSLKQKVAEKTGVTDFYMEQLKTYDALDRDPRGRVLSVAYIGLTNQEDMRGDWWQIHKNESYGTQQSYEIVRHTEGMSEVIEFDALAFDHGTIIKDAMERLCGKIWYTDLPKYILQNEFTIRDAAILFEQLGLPHVPQSNFARRLAPRIQKTDSVRNYAEEGGRPAALYRWKAAENQ